MQVQPFITAPRRRISISVRHLGSALRLLEQGDRPRLAYTRQSLCAAQLPCRQVVRFLGVDAAHERDGLVCHRSRGGLHGAGRLRRPCIRPNFACLMLDGRVGVMRSFAGPLGIAAAMLRRPCSGVVSWPRTSLADLRGERTPGTRRTHYRRLGTATPPLRRMPASTRKMSGTLILPLLRSSMTATLTMASSSASESEAAAKPAGTDCA